ncbi:MAG: hypothetical protein ACK557_07345 [Planctomycetota bacterium]
MKQTIKVLFREWLEYTKKRFIALLPRLANPKPLLVAVVFLSVLISNSGCNRVKPTEVQLANRAIPSCTTIFKALLYAIDQEIPLSCDANGKLDVEKLSRDTGYKLDKKIIVFAIKDLGPDDIMDSNRRRIIGIAYPEIEESLNGEKRHVIIFRSDGIPGFQRFSQKVIRKTEKKLAAGEFFMSIDPKDE